MNQVFSFFRLIYVGSDVSGSYSLILPVCNSFLFFLEKRPLRIPLPRLPLYLITKQNIAQSTQHSRHSGGTSDVERESENSLLVRIFQTTAISPLCSNYQQVSLVEETKKAGPPFTHRRHPPKNSPLAVCLRR